MRPTIYAVSSGAPPAAIAVLRISGPAALAAVRKLTDTLPAPRVARLRRLRGADGNVLDDALVLVFPGPDSATGEDLVELHLHGGRATVAAVSAALAAMPGLEAAGAGAFTRRAMENGRLDLIAAEALGDLLAAETQAQRRAALRVDGLSAYVADWTTRTVAAAALLEGAIDHGDEEELADDLALVAAVRAECSAVAGAIAAVLAAPPAERLRDGVRVVFAGPPNSGKSSLFNRMAGREAAIVSPIAGTTRDRIEAPVVRGGVAWLLIDTAGLTETDDPIEAIGVSRAQDAVAAADIVLWLGDGAPPEGAIAVHARCDAAGRDRGPAGRIALSSATGEGVETLWNTMSARAATLLPGDDQLALNARQRHECRLAAFALRDAAAATDLLIAAEHIRLARRAYDRLTGRADTEAVLDALFAGFCIGK